MHEFQIIILMDVNVLESVSKPHSFRVGGVSKSVAEILLFFLLMFQSLECLLTKCMPMDKTGGCTNAHMQTHTLTTRAIPLLKYFDT